MRSVFFMVFELFFNSISFRKQILIILIRRKSSEFCPVEVKFVQPCARVITNSANILHKFASASLIAYRCVRSLISFEQVFNTLLVPLLINEVNKIFDTCSFYVCMEVRT